MMESSVSLVTVSFLVLLASIVLVWNIYSPSLTNSKYRQINVKSHYWTTIVGVENEPIDGLDSFIAPLQSKFLLGLKRVERQSNPLLNSLSIDLPDQIVGGLIAVYEADPHLNWRGHHLLYQGPLELERINLAFPLLQCGRARIHPEALEVQDTLLVIKPGFTMETIEKIKTLITQKEALEITIDKAHSFTFTPELVDFFYAEHLEKAFYKELKSYMTSGPSIAMIICGRNAIKVIRKLLGPTDPKVARDLFPESFRAVYGIDMTRNAFHASANPKDAAREIGLLCTKLD